MSQTNQASADSLAETALSIVLSRELASENERMSKENEKWKPALDLSHTVKIYFGGGNKAVLSLQDGFLDDVTGQWKIPLQHNQDFNHLYKIGNTISGVPTDTFGSFIMIPSFHKAWIANQTVHLNYFLRTGCFLQGTIQNIDGPWEEVEAIITNENNFQMSVMDQGFVNAETGQPVQRFGQRYSAPFRNATFAIESVLIDHSVVQLHLKTGLQHVEPPHNIISLKSVSPTVHKQTSAAWEEYKSLAQENFACRNAHEMAQKVSFVYGGGEPINVSLYLREGTREMMPCVHSRDVHRPFWVVRNENASDGSSVPLDSIKTAKISVAGIQLQEEGCQWNRLVSRLTEHGSFIMNYGSLYAGFALNTDAVEALFNHEDQDLIREAYTNFHSYFSGGQEEIGEGTAALRFICLPLWTVQEQLDLLGIDYETTQNEE